MKFYNNLKNNKKPICVWGTGYIGLSTLSYYAKNKINALGYDVNQNLVNDLNKGNIKNDDFKKWLGFDIKNLIKRKKLNFTNKLRDIKKENPEVHFVCIPTEKNGKPLNKILVKTVKNIQKISSRGVIIIESTLTPGTGDKIVAKMLNKNFEFIIAPRRDWFVDDSKTLEFMDRVYGCHNQKNNNEINKILSIVCKKLHKATSHRVAEMVKSFENAYRHVDIALANQLSIAYPNDNIREVLQLVGTKWNIGTFYPGFGSGGYCIPLSSQYVLQGSSFTNRLSILKNTIKIDKDINLIIAKSLIKHKIKKVAVLGLSYKANLKVSTLSPIIDFCKFMKKNNKVVDLFDPYFNSNETLKITNCKKINNFPYSLKNYDCVVFAVGHDFFIKNKKKILKNLNCKILFDNTGLFSDNKKYLENKNIKYKLAGSKQWI